MCKMILKRFDVYQTVHVVEGFYNVQSFGLVPWKWDGVGEIMLLRVVLVKADCVGRSIDGFPDRI
jgi:hypothetical protein